MTLRAAISAAGLVTALAGCAGKDAEETCADETVSLSDANNFAYSGDLTLPVFETAAATDIEVCWDALSSDIQCHEMDPVADIDNVGLVRFPYLTHEDVEAGLSSNNLQQADISGYVEYNTSGETCIGLEDMSFFGTAIDVAAEYTADGGTYMLLLASGTDIGVGTRMLAFMDPSETSDVTRVDLPDGCGVLDFAADVTSLDTVGVCPDGSSTLDWSSLTVDGLGNEMSLIDIDSLSLGFYEGQSLADLEAQFLDLEFIATRWYSMEIEGGTQADLTGAATADGEAFPGFEGDGIWLLALRCSTCYNPAPLFLTVLEPTEG